MSRTVYSISSCVTRSCRPVQSQYEIKNDMEMMALVAMHHNSGSVWNPSYSTKGVGNWRSGFAAHSYLEGITCDDFIKMLRKYCMGKA